LFGPPEDTAGKIKQDIRAETGLTCSAGIAPNKFLAKIASDLEKPDGLTVIEQATAREFLSGLPISKIPGVGSKTLMIMERLGVRTVSDILRFPDKFWIDKFGKAGMVLLERARGIDPSPVIPRAEPKSFSTETTFSHDTADINELRRHLLLQAERVGRDLRRHGYLGRTIILKIKFSDFKTVSRSRTLRDFTHSTGVIFRTARDLLGEIRLARKVRLAGIGIANLAGRGMRQLSLITDNMAEKEQQLDMTVDMIRKKFGEGIIKRAGLLDLDN